MPRAHLCRAGLKALQAPEVAAVRKLQEQVYLGSAFLVHEPGEEQFPGPGLPGLLDSHGARGAPHLDGCVIAGCQEQLLLHRAEGHRVDHVVVLQLGQADVIVPVPDVAVAIFCPAAADKTAVRTPARQTLPSAPSALAQPEGPASICRAVTHRHSPQGKQIPFVTQALPQTQVGFQKWSLK